MSDTFCANDGDEPAYAPLTARLTADERRAMVAKIVLRSRHHSAAEHAVNVETAEAALQCVDAGLYVIEVHSLTDEGECTCLWGNKKAEKHGLPLKTCPSPGKHARGVAWQKNKTDNREHVLSRWSDTKSIFNMGVVIGGDVMLIDVDGPEGAATMARWRREGLLPATVTVVTGSGGHHLYYRIPPGWDMRNSVKAIGSGIDVRGENGFAVGPGSRHKSGVDTQWAGGKGIYRWLEEHSPDDVDISDAPVMLLRKCWFATKARRYETAPDGSRWEQAGLDELPDESAAETKSTTSTTVAKRAVAKTPGRVTAEATSGGWEAKVELIGHGDGERGFNTAIYVAACSFFGSQGYEADIAPLKAALLARIAVAPEDTVGHRDAYLDDSENSKTNLQIQAARDFVKAQPNSVAIRTRRAPSAVSSVQPFADVLGVDEAIAELTGESTTAEVEAVMRRLHATAAVGDDQKRMLVRRIGRQLDGIDSDLRGIKDLWTDVAWAEDHARPDTTDINEVRDYMSRRYASVRWGKDFVYVDMTRPSILPVVADSLVAEYRDTRIIVEAKDKDGQAEVKVIPNWFKWWSAQPGAVPRFDDVVFKPHGHVVSNKLNLFRNTGARAIKGDWSLMRRHIYENICDRNPYRFAYLIATIASWVQRPDVKKGVAVVLRGPKGAGKNVFIDWVCELFPNNSGVVTNADQMFASFTAGSAYQIVVHVEEGFWAGDKKREGQFKSMITSHRQSLHPKGFDAIEIDDHHHYLLSTNEKWAIPASFDERRFFVLDVNPKRAKDTRYFGAIVQSMESGGLEAMRYDLMNLGIPDWVDLRNPPQTKALLEQAELSAEAHVRWWKSCLETGEIVVPVDRELGKMDEGGRVEFWPDADLNLDGSPIYGSNRLKLSTRDVQLSYQAYAAQHREWRAISVEALGRYLRDMEIAKVRDAVGIGGYRQWAYDFPPLSELREAYTQQTGVRFDAEDVTDLPAGASEQALSGVALWGLGVISPHR